MSVRARFYVAKIEKNASNGGGGFMGVTLQPCVRPTNDNITWSKYTPSGKLEMNVTADGAGEWFESMLGKDVAITFDVPEEFPDGLGR